MPPMSRRLAPRWHRCAEGPDRAKPRPRERDYPKGLIDLTIAHVVEDKAEAAYRRGSMLQKRHVLMADWERYCNGR